MELLFIIMKQDMTSIDFENTQIIAEDYMFIYTEKG